MQQRKAFIDEYLKKEHSVSELCRRFEVSRKTAYKWIDRFMAGCELVDRSRRPHTSPRAIAAALEDAIVEARKKRPNWGPKKLRAALALANPGVLLPSVSTFALVFKRNGLITPRRRRRRTPPSTLPFAEASGPNALWCIDFKGDFLVGRRRCYPLTVMDAYSRFLLGCVALPNTRAGGVRKAMRTLFETFGLPAAIRSDNGSPFASKAPAGLSELSAWWLKLGIRHERIEPGKPQQNGRHERMHLTLKLETAMPPASSMRAQQRVFDRFRLEYNERRPHEALGQRFPAEHYRRSHRPLPQPYWGSDFVYPDGFETARVRKSGSLPWNDRSAFVSTVLKYELLGLEWQHDGAWRVHFGPLPLGTLSSSSTTLAFSSI
jgi:transposase InsO family protein